MYVLLCEFPNIQYQLSCMPKFYGDCLYFDCYVMCSSCKFSFMTLVPALNGAMLSQRRQGISQP